MLYFITGNKPKIASAKLSLDKYGITFEPKSIPLVEIQSTSMEEIALRKAYDSFNMIKQPLIIKDDGWFITALNGFPGPYMKYVNDWLIVDDFLRLLKNKHNREVIFHEVVYYIDSHNTKSFSNKLRGTILSEPKGNGFPFSKIVTFRKDGKTLAECDNEKLPLNENRTVWNDFAKWYKTLK